MFKTEVHKLKRYFQRIGIKITKATRLEEKKVTTGEREAIGILNRIVKDPEVDLLTCPNTEKYYVKCNKKNMLIVIGKREINIINHVYSYTVQLCEKSENIIKDIFLDEVEKRRKIMEKEFTESVTFSLKKIYNNLNKIENEK
jgi:hypothetical protein